MSNYIAIKSHKVKCKIKNKVSAELYSAVQEKCKSIPQEDIGKYSKIVSVVSLRTTYSNKVLMLPSGKCHHHYELKFEHNERNLYNLSILSSKQFFLDSCNGEVPMSVLSRSGAYPIGIASYNDTFYLLSHIVIEDEVLELPEFKLTDGHSFIDISDYKPEDELEKIFADKLIHVNKKEE